MNDEEDILANDRESFPQCMHSTSISKSCSMKDGGKMVCDTIRRIQRVCPDRTQNKDLINKKETSDEAAGLLAGFGSLGSIFGAFGGGGSDGSQGSHKGDLPGDLPGEIQQFMKAIESMDRMQQQRLPEKREDRNRNRSESSHQSKGFDIDRSHRAPRAIPKNHAPNHTFPYNDEYDKILDEALGNSSKGDKKRSPKGPIERI